MYFLIEKLNTQMVAKQYSIYLYNKVKIRVSSLKANPMCSLYTVSALYSISVPYRFLFASSETWIDRELTAVTWDGPVNK